MDKGVCIISGGLDSCVTAYMMSKMLKLDMYFLSFNYGQKHVKELIYAKLIAEKLNSTIKIIDLTSISSLLENSSLIGDTPVPEGFYHEENMRSTVVQNRNAIMLSIAWGYACSIGAKKLGCGVHAGDHFIYPDCRPEFMQSLEKAFKKGTQGCGSDNLSLFTPFINMDKTFIIKEGAELGVDFSLTWTCYKGEEMPCGSCGACDERKVSFKNAGIIDPLIYRK